MPLAGSNRARRDRPPSTTTRISGRVSEVSAMDVASTMRRPSATGPVAARWAAKSIAPNSGRTTQPGGRRPFSSASTFLISPSPGRKASTPPSAVSDTACRIRSAIAGSRRIGPSGLGSQRVSTGKARPAEVITGASPIRAATGAASSVADITITTSSSRRAARTSSARASPRSAFSERSWNSSKISAPIPSSDGSDWIIRVRMPSVTTSILVARLTFASPRIR